ncbi:MAG: DUF3347 domain-containing protein [Planctomycetes bacterium]|nr:DUF3347 domain-containing protein [Planctomycetota bacterium]
MKAKTEKRSLTDRIKAIGKAALKLVFVVAILAAFVAGYWLRSERFTPTTGEPGKTETKKEKKATRWTCSMHPQINLPAPGKCPICGMTLIPLEGSSGGDEHPRRLVMSEAAKALAEIETAPVQRKFVDAVIRMQGMLDYDQTRIAYITAWIAGRLDKLYVDYAGVPVEKGEHMVYIYSPELLATQEDLLEAVRRLKNIKSDEFKMARKLAKSSVEASRKRLLLWGLLPRQIEEIEKSGKATDHLTIYAPMSGIVVKKHVLEGAYVKEGTRIYTIADLTELWALLDAYESDMEWIRYGQRVEFTTEAYPGEKFEGWISLIEPVLTEKTRTVKLRVNVDNPDGRLKPNMFVRALVKAKVAQGGKVMAERMVGKWICSMHPDVVRDTAGICPICGMPLVRTESLGYATKEKVAEPPLVIPVSAPLVTGTRAVVYVEVPDQERPTYEGREIVLGPRAQNYYLVEEGLKEGERVVVKGNFKLDSELQIQAKPSMMSPEAAEGTPSKQKKPSYKKAEAPKQFHEQLSAVIGAYLKMQKALTGNDFKAAQAAASELQAGLGKVDMKLLKGPAHMVWMKEGPSMSKAVKAAASTKDIGGIRKEFAALSDALTAVVKSLGHREKSALFQFRCTMALDGRGADWLQADKNTANPYLGASMLKCGDQIERIPPETEAKSGPRIEVPKAFHSQLSAVISAYLKMQKALAGDDFKAAQAAASELQAGLGKVDMKLLKGPAHMIWMKEGPSLSKTAGAASSVEDIEKLRKKFALLSDALIGVVKRLGQREGKSLFQFHCPMALGNRGADWLQADKDTANPYFGGAMLKCGERVGEIPAAK